MVEESVSKEKQTKQDIKTIKGFLSYLPSAFLLLIACSFASSFLFNTAYFSSDGYNYLSILTLQDYLEGSIFWVFIVALILFYSHSSLTDELGIKKRWKRAKKDSVDIQNEIKKYPKFLQIILFPILIFLVALLTVLQFLAVLTPYLVLLYLFVPALQFSTESSIYSHSDVVTAFVVIAIAYFAIDLMLSKRPEKYDFRVKLMRSLLIISAFSFVTGITQYIKHASCNRGFQKISLIENEVEGRFMRAFDKGILYYDCSYRRVKFVVWDQIKSF